MRHVIGLELGVRKITMGVVDKYGKLIRKETTPSIDCCCEDVFREISVLIKQVLVDENIDIKSVKSIGVGGPGIPNKTAGTIKRKQASNLIIIPVRAELQKYFNLPVYVDNDGNCAALAESITGAAEDIAHSVLIRPGNGIGGGIIINNRIYSGFNHTGAELGHMCIAMGGEECACGRRGCWDSYASVSALIRQTAQAAQRHPESLINTLTGGNPESINVFTAFEAAKQGDAVAKEVVEKYLIYLGEGITNLVNILMPNAVIIGGELAKLGESLLKPLREIVLKNVYTQETEMPQFKTAELGSAAVVIGAAMLGIYRDISPEV
jgi:glucokinase